MKVVVVGGVAGGASAAARLRRLDESAQILIFERSGFISYANCGLPYYIGGVITEKRELTLQTPESFWTRFRIDALVHHEVLRIDRKNKKVTVKNLDTGRVYEETYDKLILSPGARPVLPDLPGIDSRRVYTLRTVEDTLKIRESVEREKIRSAVMIGGGFIGVELAENLRRLGIEVSIVEKLPQLLGQFDADMASFLHAHIREKGIHLHLGRSVEQFLEENGGISVCMDGGEKLFADIAIAAVGVLPESTLAAEAGLTLGVKNSIAVNEHMQTSDPDIYAVGDAAEITNGITGQKTVMALAGPANKQGRIAADHICGIKRPYRGAAGTSVLKVFDMTAASAGLNERAARAAGIAYEKVILSPVSHASYYPGGKVMTIKLLFEKTGKILGAQIAGFDGVDKRIDVLATAMQANLTVTELCDLDLAYAPPYSSAKDPINMAGFVAENVLAGRVKQFFYEDALCLPRDGSVTLLDTRTEDEYRRGHAEGFDLNIPVDRLRERLEMLDRTKPVYVMCQSGLRSYIACRILTQSGFDCYNFAGGYRVYNSIHSQEAASASAYPCGMAKSQG